MSEWISVNEKLPEHGQFVLVFVREGIMTVVRADVSKCNYIFMTQDLRHQVFKVTHWMPLPEPPKENE